MWKLSKIFYAPEKYQVAKKGNVIIIIILTYCHKLHKIKRFSGALGTGIICWHWIRTTGLETGVWLVFFCLFGFFPLPWGNCSPASVVSDSPQHQEAAHPSSPQCSHHRCHRFHVCAKKNEHEKNQLSISKCEKIFKKSNCFEKQYYKMVYNVTK